MTTGAFLTDRGLDRAAALAYISLLSLVPLLATGAALYQAFFSIHADRIIEVISVILPYSTDVVAGTLSDFVNRATALGGVATVVFIAIAYRLFLSVEITFNDIWGVTTHRRPATRMFSFTMLMFWGPVVMGLGSSLLIWIGHRPWAPSQTLLLSTGRLVLPLLGLTMVYWLAPATGVHIGAALAGAALATAGLQLLRAVFAAYIDVFPDVNIIYGSLTLAILFLVSLFAFWALVILGAEASYVVQNFRSLRMENEGRIAPPGDPAVMALAVVAECTRCLLARDRPANMEQIEQELGITHAEAQRLTDRLLEERILAVTGPDRDRFVPGRQASTLTPAEALAPFTDRTIDRLPSGEHHLGRLREVLARADDARTEVLESTTFGEIVASGRADRPSPEAVRRTGDGDG